MTLDHSEAIDALCGCAATVSILSYQEAIEGYFKLRGLLIPPDSSASAADSPDLIERVRETLIYADQTIRSLPTADQSHVEPIRALLSDLAGLR